VVHGLADAVWGTKRFVAFLDADGPHVYWRSARIATVRYSSPPPACR
jgi:hypothetical protein